MTLQAKLDAFKADFVAGTPPYNAPSIGTPDSASTHPVARELAPAGLQSSPEPCNRYRPEGTPVPVLGPLRSPAGASSLATGCRLPLRLRYWSDGYRSATCAECFRPIFAHGTACFARRPAYPAGPTTAVRFLL